MDEDNQPTPALKVLRHPATLLALSIPAIILSILLVAGASKLVGADKTDATRLLLSVWVAGAFVGVYALFRRYVEGQPVREFALKGALLELAAGIAIGLVLFSAIVGVIAALGGYRVIGYHDVSVLVPVLGIAILSGFSEEIAFRGYFFRLTERWLGSWTALILSAALFGALHLGNKNATPLAAVAIMLEAGIMLAAIYMITRRLWAAIGVHAAWNFAQGGIYGIPVSGGAMDGVLRPDIRGSDLLTGGAFGAEASLPAIVVATTFGLALLVVAYRRGTFMPPIWVRRRLAKTKTAAQGAGAAPQV